MVPPTIQKVMPSGASSGVTRKHSPIGVMGVNRVPAASWAVLAVIPKNTLSMPTVLTDEV